MSALTSEEEKFVEYWEQNRLKKRKITKQLSIGLPIGVLLVTGIFASVFARWDKHADVQMREEMQYTASPTLILVFIVAAVLIVAFFVIDRKSTRLNSSHPSISYAVFCLKKKNNNRVQVRQSQIT